MAFIEVRTGGKLVKHQFIDDARARRGCRIRVGSAKQVRLMLGQSTQTGKYEISIVEGESPNEAPEAGGQTDAVTASFLPMSEVGEWTSVNRGIARSSQHNKRCPKIEGYQILAQLGEGGMGTVWRAVQLSTKREVAIKFLNRHSFDSKRSRARFEREVSLAARLTHPNIARVYHSGIHQGVYYYAMELVEGVHLDKYVHTKQLSYREILELMKGICDAINHAHDRGIIHRDLKPSNILVTEDAQAHIVDFGLAKGATQEENELTISIEGEVAGTLAYMAPEQAAGRLDMISARTDIYSLGAIAYELLTGRLPHQPSGSRYETIKSIVEDEVQSPRESSPSIDGELESILLSALAKRPEDRYASASLFLQDIDNYLKGEPILASPPSKTYLIRKRIGKHFKAGALFLGFTVVLLAVVAMALFSVSTERQRRIEAEQKITGTTQSGRQETGESLPTVDPATSSDTEPLLKTLPVGSPAGHARQIATASSLFHIDPVNGDDSNNGSLASPWKTFGNITSYSNREYRPSGWVKLRPGDQVYLMDGIFSEMLHTDDVTGPAGEESFIVYFESVDGTAERPICLKAYPGHHPIIDPKGLAVGAMWRRCRFWEISGIEIVNAKQCGMALLGVEDCNVYDINIYDTNGMEENTVAGLSVWGESRNVTIYSSTFYDNYDRICASAGGKTSRSSTNVVIDNSVDITVHDCLIYQTLPVSSDLSGAGLRYEYPCSDPNAYFHVYGNVFKNCKFLAFGSGTANTHFHHNLIIGGHGIQTLRYAGTPHRLNQVYEYNTLYNIVDCGFGLTPTHPVRIKPFSGNPVVISFHNNIIYDATVRYTHEKGAISIGTHMSDELYALAVCELDFDNNCYYNPYNAVQFGFCAHVDPDLGRELGGIYSLSQWQVEYGYDVNSLEADPLFVAPDENDFHLRPDSPCLHMGVYGNLVDEP